MAYTPPAYNAANFTWQGKSSYTPGAHNATDFAFTNDGTGVASTTATASCAIVGFQAGANSAAAAATGSSTATSHGGAVRDGVFTQTPTSTAAAPGRAIAVTAGSTAVSVTSSVKLGYGVDSAATATGTTASQAVSSVIAAAAETSASSTCGVVGAWDGPSGGDAVATGQASTSIVGQSVDEAVAEAAGSSVIASEARAIWACVATSGEASGASAVSAVVRPVAGYALNRGWDGGTTAQGTSGVVGGVYVTAGRAHARVDNCRAYGVNDTPVEGVATSSAPAASSMLGSIKGDASFTVDISVTVDGVGVGDLTAASTAGTTCKVIVLGRSADSRTSRFVSAISSTATAVGTMTKFAGAVASAGAESNATASGFSTLYVGSVAESDAGASAYSYGGLPYDEANTVYMYTVTKPREVAILIGA